MSRGREVPPLRAAAVLFGLTVLLQLLAYRQYLHDPFLATPVSDALSYHRWALRLAAEGLGTEGVFHQAPLFPLLLAAVYRLAASPAAYPGWAAALQGALTALAIALLVPIGRRCFGSTAAGVLGALAALLHGPVLFAALKLLPVPLALATQALGLALLLEARATRHRVLALGAGLACGLACLTRSEMLLFLPFAALALLRRDPRGRARAVPVLLFAAGALLALFPAALHNARRGDFVPVASAGGENLFIGNQRGADGGHTALDPHAGDIFSQRLLARTIAERETGRPLRPSGVSAYWTGRALDEIRADPAAWLALEARKLGRILDPGDPTDMYSLALERRLYLPLFYLLPLSAGALWLLALLGATLALPRAWSSAWPLVALIGVACAVLLAFFVSTRLRLPLLFFLAPLAGAGALALSAAWRGGGRPRRLAALGATLVVGLCLADPWLSAAPPREIVRLASVLSTQGRLDASLEVLAPLVGAAHPDPLALDQAGWVRSKRGEATAARELYRRALDLGLPPEREPSTRTRLAALEEQAGDLDAARRELDAAVASPFADAGSWYERAGFRLRRGDRAGAVADLRAALSRDPDFEPARGALEALGGDGP